MQDKASRNQDFSLRIQEDTQLLSTAESVRLEMQEIVRLAAEPRQPDDRIKTMIFRAGRRLGIGLSRAKKFWYGEISVVPAHEADALRKARHQILRDRAARLNAELEILQLRLRNLEND